jgi:ATPase subunit of ABC transporter with duplicated ATPase domains
MTATLVAKNVAGGFAHRTLFEGLDLTVAPGDVVGVVGANGAGKSTLLRILAGDIEPLDGKVSLAPADAFVGWLPQEHERVSGESVAGYIARRTGCTAATLTMDAAAAALADPGEASAGMDPADRYSLALDHWLATGAADLDERLPAVLADLGLGSDAVQPESAPMTALSGGQAARVGLAALMLSRFDIVLLDEPTNDLDLDGLDRLPRLARPHARPADGTRDPARRGAEGAGQPGAHRVPDHPSGGSLPKRAVPSLFLHNCDPCPIPAFLHLDVL